MVKKKDEEIRQKLNRLRDILNNFKSFQILSNILKQHNLVCVGKW